MMAQNELLFEICGELVVEMCNEPIVEMSGHYYDPPEGFVKPAHYPGLQGMEHEAALGKGYVDLGLINPQGEGPKDKKLKASILRHVVKLLISSQGKQAFIRDPEWVLKQVYPGQMVKTVLKDSVEEALEAMFDMPVSVTISGFKGKTGFGWRFKAPALAKHPKVAA
jgi:hypothetical protein